jgi:hypothetical protein
MYSGNKDGEKQVASENLSGSKVYLRVDFDVPVDRGTATFYYSTDGTTWTKIGSDVKLNYDLHMFVGVRWGLFNFATKTPGGYADFDWFKVGVDYKDEIYMDMIQDTTPPTPFKDIAAKIPGKVEIEDYDVGRSGKAYYDNDGDNQGKAYREDGVDIVGFECSDEDNTKDCGGYAIGYTAAGEWLRYTVNFDKTGSYEVRVNMATPSENAGVKLYIDGKAITDEIIAKQNGENDWSTYSTVTATTSEIAAGEHALKLEIVGNNVNVDWVEFCEGSCTTEGIAQKVRYDVQTLQAYRVYSLNGSFIGSVSAASVREAQAKVGALVSEKGVYLLKPRSGHAYRFTVTK